MQNTIKRIVVCLLIVAVCCGFALFAVACNDNKDKNKNNNTNNTDSEYVVKVQYADGTPVTEGTAGMNEDELQVQICIGTQCMTPKAVDSTGTAKFKVKVGDEGDLTPLQDGESYHVKLLGVPDGYTYDAEAADLTFTKPCTVTITLMEVPPTPTTYAYVVKVQYADGTPVTEGKVRLSADIAEGGYVDVALNASGLAQFEEDDLPSLGDASRYKAEFSGLYGYVGIAYTDTADDDGNIVITLTDETNATYVATVKDQYGNPIVGEPFVIYYLDEDYANVEVTTALSDASGVVTFKIIKEAGEVQYYFKAGENFNDKYRLIDTWLGGHYVWGSNKFDNENKATVVYDYFKDMFTMELAEKLNYKRAAVLEGTSQFAGEASTLTLKADEYGFFVFNPYVAPSNEIYDHYYNQYIAEYKAANGGQNPDDSALELIDRAAGTAGQALAANAASGLYRVKVKITGSATANMYLLARGIENNFSWSDWTAADKLNDEENDYVLAYVLNTADGYIDVELFTDENNKDFIFGIIANADCTVTVEVERTGDSVYTVPTPTVTVIQPSGEIAEVQDADLQQGYLTAVPAGSTLVKDSNGFYHIGSADGKLVYAVLNKPVAGADLALSEFDKSTQGTACFYFDTVNDRRGKPISHNDYLALVKAYGAAAKNDEGVYPLNDDLKTFLEKKFAHEGYLVACVYFGDEDPAAGNVLTVGPNQVSVSLADAANWGKVYTFTSVNGGTYTISIDESLKTSVTITDPIDYESLIYCGVFTNASGMQDYRASSEFTLTAGQTIEFCINYDQYGVQFTVTITESGNTPPQQSNTLVEGDNTVTLTADNAYDGVLYTFTSANGGTFVISIEENAETADLLVSAKDDYDEVYIGEKLDMSHPYSYTFTLQAGGTFEFLFSNANGHGNYAVTITAGGEVDPPQPVTPSEISGEGGNVNFAADKFYFSTEEPGDFEFALNTQGLSAGINAVEFVLKAGNVEYTLNRDNLFKATVKITGRMVGKVAISIIANGGWNDVVPVSVNQLVNNISIDFSKDYVAFEIAEAGTYVFTLKNVPNGMGDNQCLSLKLGNIIAGSFGNGNMYYYPYSEIEIKAEDIVNGLVFMSTSAPNGFGNSVEFKVSEAVTAAHAIQTLVLDQQGEVNFAAKRTVVSIDKNGTYTFAFDKDSAQTGLQFELKVGNETVQFNAANNYCANVTVAEADIVKGVVIFSISQAAGNVFSGTLNVTVSKYAPPAHDVLYGTWVSDSGEITITFDDVAGKFTVTSTSSYIPSGEYTYTSPDASASGDQKIANGVSYGDLDGLNYYITIIYNASTGLTFSIEDGYELEKVADGTLTKQEDTPPPVIY